MLFYELPGRTTAIAKHILEKTHLRDERLALGGAIAAMSALSASNYVVPIPGATITFRYVTQGVGLYGQGGSGKSSTVSAVDDVFHALGIGDRIVRFCSSARDAQRIATRDGVLWVEDYSTHLHVAKYQDQFEREHTRPRVADILGQVQLGAYPGRTAAPFTFFVVSRPDAFETKLPADREFSPFFGDLLWVAANRTRVHNHSPSPPVPPADLVDGLRCMVPAREVPIVLACARGVLDTFAEAYRHALRTGHSTQTVHRLVNVAALLAIGADPDHPTITLDHAEAAGEVASASNELMRSGLDV